MAGTERTEPGTPKRKREARERGEVVRSQELAAGFNLVSGLAAVGAGGALCFQQFRAGFLDAFRAVRLGEWEPESLSAGLRTFGERTLLVLVPLLGGLWLAAALVNYLQVGFHVAGQVVTPKLDRINPLTGFKRIFSLRGWVELAKASVKIAVAGWLVGDELMTRLPGLLSLSGAPLGTSLTAAGALFWGVAWKIGFFFLAVGLADYFWQRFDFLRKLRMTRQEVRDEMRETEGDPLIRSQRRSRHRRLARVRVAAEVARADVVTVNPIHYAVALRYEPQRMRAPRVVAKGQRLWAKLIARLARRHGVPVITNPPLTRLLYHEVEVGQEIPPALYRAVAEILAALFRLKARKGGKA
jgi:flagellar biosynthetic protein FlhB